MRSDLTLEDVISMNNSNKIIFINSSCDDINYRKMTLVAYIFVRSH